MNEQVAKLEPQSLWKHFTDLNAVPRPSKKEARVISFITDFGQKLGLSTYVDEVGNVIIKKPATAGLENRETVILQSHLDMVHQKNAGTQFDFDTEGIRMRVDGDWVRADGTTLGADNGIGVASIMALLSAKDIPHPAIEALFTIDEETGMTGAMGLKGGLLKGKILLNLDTEDDHELTIGCAGGIDVTASGHYQPQTAPGNCSWFMLTVKGLTGGHSGMDIHRGRANANQLMNRLLRALNDLGAIQLASIDGGSLRNAIPRESTAVVGVHDAAAAMRAMEQLAAVFKSEHSATDPSLDVIMTPSESPQTVVPSALTTKFIAAVAACPVGIWRMSPEIEGLVQTSNNLARVVVGDGKYTVMCLTRSAVDSEKADEATAIKGLFELIGAEVTFGGSYPGWTPRPDAAIVKTMTATYNSLFADQPLVNACHAGLECGILGANYPDVEMVSFGPNIKGAHSPDEAVQISSVQKFWKWLLLTLTQIPNAA